MIRKTSNPNVSFAALKFEKQPSKKLTNTQAKNQYEFEGLLKRELQKVGSDAWNLNLFSEIIEPNRDIIISLDPEDEYNRLSCLVKQKDKKGGIKIKGFKPTPKGLEDLIKDAQFFIMPS
jgi:hypothetical protein